MCVSCKCVPKMRVVNRNHEFESRCVCVCRASVSKSSRRVQEPRVLDQVCACVVQVRTAAAGHASAVTSCSFVKSQVPLLNFTFNWPSAEMPTTSPTSPASHTSPFELVQHRRLPRGWPASLHAARSCAASRFRFSSAAAAARCSLAAAACSS